MITLEDFIKGSALSTLDWSSLLSRLTNTDTKALEEELCKQAWDKIRSHEYDGGITAETVYAEELGRVIGETIQKKISPQIKFECEVDKYESYLALYSDNIDAFKIDDYIDYKRFLIEYTGLGKYNSIVDSLRYDFDDSIDIDTDNCEFVQKLRSSKSTFEFLKDFGLDADDILEVNDEGETVPHCEQVKRTLVSVKAIKAFLAAHVEGISFDTLVTDQQVSLIAYVGEYEVDIDNSLDIEKLIEIAAANKKAKA